MGFSRPWAHIWSFVLDNGKTPSSALHSRCHAWPCSHRLSRSHCLFPGSLHPPHHLRPPLLAAESSWARLDLGMWRCLVVASPHRDEAQSRALDGEAEIRGLALSTEGLSRLRAKMATKCPTCTSVNIKDLLSRIHTRTSLNCAGDAGFGSQNGQTLMAFCPKYCA